MVAHQQGGGITLGMVSAAPFTAVRRCKFETSRIANPGSAWVLAVIMAAGIVEVSPADHPSVVAYGNFGMGIPPSVYPRSMYPLTSPITDSEGGSGSAWWLDDKTAAGLADDWYLPPALGGAETWVEGAMGGSACTSMSGSEDSGYSAEEREVRRRCNLCKLMDATRGVTDEGQEGLWSTLLCRHCAQFIKKTISISTRCHVCKRFANFGPIGGKRSEARHCKRHRRADEVNVSIRRCAFKDEGGTRCRLPPAPGGVSRSAVRMCEGHRTLAVAEGWLDSGRARMLGGRRCAADGCDKHASFGNSVTGAILCAKHSGGQHIDLIHRRRCEAVGCPKQPSFGAGRNAAPRFCSTHKPASFIDLKARKCQHPYGCGKRPSFGDPADGIARYCMQHKLRRHVNVKSRKCQEQGCAKQPSFGAATDLVVRFCAVHRRESDVDLVHQRCNAPGCDKFANFAPGQSPGAALLCSRHRIGVGPLAPQAQAKANPMPSPGPTLVLGAPVAPHEAERGPAARNVARDDGSAVTRSVSPVSSAPESTSSLSASLLLGPGGAAYDADAECDEDADAGPDGAWTPAHLASPLVRGLAVEHAPPAAPFLLQIRAPVVLTHQ